MAASFKTLRNPHIARAAERKAAWRKIARTPDAAVLDVNISGEPAYPIARRLADAGVPFVFATGYGASGIHEDWSGRPVLQTPFQCDTLAAGLVPALQARGAADIKR